MDIEHLHTALQNSFNITIYKIRNTRLTLRLLCLVSLLKKILHLILLKWSCSIASIDNRILIYRIYWNYVKHDVIVYVDKWYTNKSSYLWCFYHGFYPVRNRYYVIGFPKRAMQVYSKYDVWVTCHSVEQCNIQRGLFKTRHRTTWNG